MTRLRSSNSTSHPSTETKTVILQTGRLGAGRTRAQLGAPEVYHYDAVSSVSPMLVSSLALLSAGVFSTLLSAGVFSTLLSAGVFLSVAECWCLLNVAQCWCLLNVAQCWCLPRRCSALTFTTLLSAGVLIFNVAQCWCLNF